MRLSIIIPAYNEENRIGNSLKLILRYLSKQDYNFEIIVVDDGSSDRTIEKVKEIDSSGKIKILKNEINKGKGYSIKKGMLEAMGEYQLFSDADLSTPIEELEKFWRYLDEDYVIVIGSRALKDSILEVRQPFYREFMGRAFNFIVRVILGFKIKDTQCGFKIFKKEVAKHIFSIQKIEGWSFDVEILYIASKLDYKIKEVPVRWINSPLSKVNPLKDALKMFFDVSRLKREYRDLKPEK